jgi:L-histidine N-alpha-methyltransferase
MDVHMDAQARLKAMAEDVRRGLGARPRWLPPKYLYDAAGSRLFDEITRLPEYYLTRAEAAIIDRLAIELMRGLAPRDLVELGSGFSAKTRTLLGARDPDEPLRYVPVDVDAETVATAARQLRLEHPDVEVHAVIGDFERHLVHVPPPAGRRLVLFLGSTIGNFHPPERHALLQQIRDLLGRDDWLLLGVDLVKDRAVLEAAYDDAAGVTARFNRNVLSVVNRELGANFRTEAFRHHARYDGRARRIEMHLVATSPQTVRIPRLALTVGFAPAEGIWTESSYKFTEAAVRTMLDGAGLRLAGWTTDAGARFALALAARAARRG